MSHPHVAPHPIPSGRARRVVRRGGAVDWRVLALVGLVLALLAAAIAFVIAVAPAMDPLAVVTVT